MLYNYPPNPVGSNWFNDFLDELLREALEARVAGRALRPWAGFLPAGHQDELRRRHGIKKRYVALLAAAETLSVPQALAALTHVQDAQIYSKVLSGGHAYSGSLGFTDEFNAAVESLFDFGYSLLSSLKESPRSEVSIRDALYERAYEAMPGHVCPFCGIDRFDAPGHGLPRHALDHYLALTIYPFFGVHLSNLIPMCDRCNMSFKNASNMLLADDGRARPCFDPYGVVSVSVSLANSDPFGGAQNGQFPAWRIDLRPIMEETETWATVFDVRRRYRESLLNAEYASWLGEFGRWLPSTTHLVTDHLSAGSALAHWATLCHPISELGFIKRPVFEMLAMAAQLGGPKGARIANLIRNLPGA